MRFQIGAVDFLVFVMYLLIANFLLNYVNLRLAGNNSPWSDTLALFR